MIKTRKIGHKNREFLMMVYTTLVTKGFSYLTVFTRKMNGRLSLNHSKDTWEKCFPIWSRRDIYPWFSITLSIRTTRYID